MNIELQDEAGYAASIRAMRLSHKSCDKSDSYHSHGLSQTDAIPLYDLGYDDLNFFVGPKDLALAQSLISKGDDHSKFMRGIEVWLDITAPRYWWQEFITYCIGVLELDPSNDFVSLNSESTIHRILKDNITVDDFEIPEFLNDDDLLCLKYSLNAVCKQIKNFKNDTALNSQQKLELIKTFLPESYLQKRSYKFSYQALRRIYNQRTGHKLPQWKKFCDFIETLPLAKELITFKKGD